MALGVTLYYFYRKKALILVFLALGMIDEWILGRLASVYTDVQHPDSKQNRSRSYLIAGVESSKHTFEDVALRALHPCCHRGLTSNKLEYDKDFIDTKPLN